MAQHHRVWRVRLGIPTNLQDPDMPQPRYHNYLFVEDLASTHPIDSTTTNSAPGTSPPANHQPIPSDDATPTNTGTIHEVTGDLVSGMHYHTRRSPPPTSDPLLHDRTLLGTVSSEDYPQRFGDVCRSQEPPGRQKKFNVATMRTEPVRGGGGFYAEGEERGRLRKCTEWTEEQLVPALWGEGVLRGVGL